MATCVNYIPVSSRADTDARVPAILLGVTNSQTCVLLEDRVRAFRDAGYSVSVISSPGEELDRIAALQSVETYCIPMHRGIALLADLKAFFTIVGTIRKIRPDIAEFSTPKAGLLGTLAAALCGVRVRIYFVRGLRLETEKGLKRLILTITERVAALCAHVVICNSQSLQEEVLGLRLASANKLCLVGSGSSNGVDIERFHPHKNRREKVNDVANDGPVIGFVGRLTRDKGIPELIVAFDKLLKEMPKARLRLVGWFDESEDALSGDLRTYIDAHAGITRTGYVPDTAPYYHGMDVMVLPTYREGFPNVVLEAAASGIPVITTLATGARDSIEPEVTGLLIPLGDSDAICAACLRLLRDGQERKAMGEAARAWVAERFVNARVLGLTVALYDGLLRDAEPQQTVLSVRAVAEQ